MQLQEKFLLTSTESKKKIAVIDKTLNKEYSYEQLIIASLLFKNIIKKYPEKHIGIMVPTSAAAFISIIATLMADKIPVMINYATLASQNCLYAQDKIGFSSILTSRKLLEKLDQEPVEGMIFLEDIKSSITLPMKLKALFASKLSSSSIQKKICHGNDDETSVIIFTSGSEKEPKAVQLSHANIMHQLMTFPKIFDLSPQDVFLGNLPVFHIFGFTLFWLALTAGASIVTHANPLEYRKIVETISKHQVTFVFGTPTFLYGYLKQSSPGIFSSIRYLIAGADKVKEHLREGFRKLHNITVLEGYGTTETSPVISSNTLENNKPGSVGKVINDMQVKIVNCETGEELQHGELGEILVKGPSVMKGYYGELEETTLRIKNGWYETGDMGLIDEDGFLWHKGRLKRFVKIGGEMISLVRVEEILEKYLPDDVLFCVVDVPDEIKGSEIVAALTTKEIDFKKVKKEMQSELPPIAIPKEFYVIENIPTMGSGKVDFLRVEKLCRIFRKEKKK
jgi:acyl-[acyl-carrier-protein]-phospholipid O-acyltransferase/long-chain-fatty-acid--[acyl-carrier-protein] ligase